MFIRIANIEYDVSDFADKHPGGSVIKYMCYPESLLVNSKQITPDSKYAFQEFHFRSKIANGYLLSLKTNDVTDIIKNTDVLDNKYKPLLEDFEKLRKSLYNRGFFEPSYFHIFYRLSELVAIFCLSTYLLTIKSPFSYIAYFLSVVGYSLFSGRCGWVQHEAGHNSFTCDIKTDKTIQKILMGLGLWTSGSMWNSMHNKHHATPQKVKHDIDLDTTPLVAFYDTAIEKNRTRFWSSTWLKYQAYTFLPITSGIFVMIFWVYYLHPRKMINDKDYEQMIYAISGHILRTLIISYYSGWNLLTSYGFLYIQMIGTGIYLFGNFSLSHSTTGVVNEDEDITWIHYAFDHTVDINPDNSWINWFMGYLNCQVVHHLFPNMPQFRQPIVSRELKVWAKKWDINYKIVDYNTAVSECFNNLNNVGEYYYYKDKLDKRK